VRVIIVKLAEPPAQHAHLQYRKSVAPWHRAEAMDIYARPWPAGRG
jgi:hypothetical protein